MNGHQKKPMAHGIDMLASAILAVIAGIAWILSPRSYIADDSYFYLVIARNLARYGEESFNRIFPANGFHPLWQYMLALWTWIAGFFDEGWQDSARLVVPVATAALCLGLWAIGRLCRGKPLAVLPSIGIPFLFLACFGHLGSEAHIHFCALTFLLLAVSSRTFSGHRRSLAIGALGGLLTLSRLDSIFVALAFVVSLLLERRNSRRSIGARLLEATLALCLMGIVIAPALLHNLLHHGGLMPVSGWMKSSFPSYFPKGWFSNGLATAWMGYCVLWGWLPLSVGTLVGVWAWRERDAAAPLLIGLASGTWCQALYIVLFTRSHTLWVWYYIDPMVLFGLAMGWVTWRIPSRVSRLGVPSLLILAALVVPLVAQSRSKRISTGQESEQVRLVRSLPENSTVLVSDFPGTAAFFSRSLVIAADFLTANRDTYESMRKHDNALVYLCQLAARAGHPLRWIVYSGNTWLRVDKDTGLIEYNDPRAYPSDKVIGRLRLGMPVIVTAITAWRLDDDCVNPEEQQAGPATGRSL